MSTNKHFPAVCALVFVLALIVTVLFMNGERLGIRVIRDEDAEESEASQYFTSNDQNTDWAATATITLSGKTATVSGPGAYVNGGSVTIASAGYYDVSGTLTDGSLTVDAEKNSKVFIRLNGVSITCSNDAAIRINQADKVFLTLAAGTENTVISGETYSAAALADKTDGAIFSHDDLTINGSGALTVTAAYKHGIAANDSLRIAGGTITVTAPSDTIHVNDSLHITGASLTLSAGDDALRSDTSIAILGGGITVNSCSEGIESPEILIEDSDITVTSTDDGINACGTETADGIDSNGNIDINGGLVYISLVGDGSNCALDYGSENGGVCRINGGTVVACGGSTMLETMSETSAQPSLLYAGATQAAGTEVALQAADGKTLLTFAAPNSFSAVLVSCPEMQLGSTYTLTLGATSQEITLTQVADSYGVSGGMGQGGGPGGMDSGINGQGAPRGLGVISGNFGGSDSTPPTPPDGNTDFQPSGDPPTRPDGKGTTAGRPSPSPGDSNAGAEPPALPDGSTAPSGQPTDSQDGQTPSADVRQIKEESFTLDENGKRLLMASAAALALGLVIAKAYRKKG